MRNELISLFAADEIRRILTEAVLPWLMVQFERRGDVNTMKKVDKHHGDEHVCRNPRSYIGTMIVTHLLYMNIGYICICYLAAK